MIIGLYIAVETDSAVVGIAVYVLGLGIFGMSIYDDHKRSSCF
jgi:hypothetical protein